MASPGKGGKGGGSKGGSRTAKSQMRNDKLREKPDVVDDSGKKIGWSYSTVKLQRSSGSTKYRIKGK